MFFIISLKAIISLSVVLQVIDFGPTQEKSEFNSKVDELVLKGLYNWLGCNGRCVWAQMHLNSTNFTNRRL